MAARDGGMGSGGGGGRSAETAGSEVGAASLLLEAGVDEVVLEGLDRVEDAGVLRRVPVRGDELAQLAADVLPMVLGLLALVRRGVRLM